MKYDIIVFGGAVVDAFLDLGIDEKKGQICIPVGSKLLVKELWFSTGGGGTNTAVAFSKLGLKTGLIGKVGKDENGSIILDELKKSRVKWLGKVGEEPTGFSVILDSRQKNRTILTSKEANDHIDFSDIPLSKLKTKWLYFSSMSGETFYTQVKLAKWAWRKKIKIAYNPSFYLTKKGARFLKPLLENVYILVLNDTEAESLVGKKKMFEKLNGLGPKIVCVTLGNKGSIVSDGISLHRAKARRIKVRERTGAGDAFAAGFVAGAIKCNDVKKAMQIGSLNAESVIQKPGAKNGLLTWGGAMRLMKHAPAQLLERKFGNNIV